MVFQDSYATLNPRLSIEDTITFGPKAQGSGRAEAKARAHEALDLVGLPPERFAQRYPHELSGGQRQRANIARARARDAAAGADPR
jgi:peptide/nickel transport system ATP-binding protein